MGSMQGGGASLAFEIGLYLFDRGADRTHRACDLLARNAEALPPINHLVFLFRVDPRLIAEITL
jgi:hypothetical protein